TYSNGRLIPSRPEKRTSFGWMSPFRPSMPTARAVLSGSTKRPPRNGRAAQLHEDQLQAGLFVLRVEVEPVRVLALGQDHGHRALEFLVSDGRGGHLVDAVGLHVVRPARVGLVDARTRIRRPAQHLAELVVIELHDFAAGHDASTLCVTVRA